MDSPSAVVAAVFHLDLMQLGRPSEDLHTVAGDQHGVLELCAEAAVRRHQFPLRPAVASFRALQYLRAGFHARSPGPLRLLPSRAPLAPAAAWAGLRPSPPAPHAARACACRSARTRPGPPSPATAAYTCSSPAAAASACLPLGPLLLGSARAWCGAARLTWCRVEKSKGGREKGKCCCQWRKERGVLMLLLPPVKTETPGEKRNRGEG
jgi:hypothetical protein